MRSVLLITLMLIGFTAQASAQQLVNLTVTIEEAQTMLTTLAEKPWSQINPLMQKLIAQVNEQTKPKAGPPPQPPPLPKGPDHEK